MEKDNEEEKIKRAYGNKSRQILDILKENKEKEVEAEQEEDER